MDDIVEFYTANLAKEKGFNEVCINTYLLDGQKLRDRYEGVDIESLYYGESTLKEELEVKNSDIEEGFAVTAPTQTSLHKWIRKENNIFIMVSHVNVSIGLKWIYEILNLPCGAIKIWTSKSDDYKFYESYEDAFEAGLVEVLEKHI